MAKKTKAPQNRITSGIQPGTAARRTLQFVERCLPGWRDDSARECADAEEALNGQLCKYLNVIARRKEFSMAYFHHEERQTGQRRVDLSALPYEPTLIKGCPFSIFEPFLVLEGKRLPAPAKNREREYVVGAESISGGIQRFKLGLHGKDHEHAGMIGYVQKGDCGEKLPEINAWIDELVTSKDALWSKSDRLTKLKVNASNRTARCESSHCREASLTSKIKLSHLWIEINN